MPVITLEVMSDSSTEHMQSQIETETIFSADHIQDPSTGLHFLTESVEEITIQSDEKEETKEAGKLKNDLFEYMLKNDGSVVCKLCGEILQSRTQWYRHKYKMHVIQPLNPAPLFQCEQCLVFFKSRKGYIGHIASRHSELLADSSPVLTNAQAEAAVSEKSVQATPQQNTPEQQEQPDPEMSIPVTSVPNYQASVVKQAPSRVTEVKRASRAGFLVDKNSAEYEEKRSREEKLVADIIDRVRRECEAQGSGGPARRGYTRRYTVMNT